MRPLAQAQTQVLNALSPLPAVAVPLESALGLVLASPVVATHPVPPFTNSAMDGYAVRSADVVSVPVELEVIEEVPAGSNPSQAVTTGTAIKIMTGAPMPAGADAVVRVENTEQSGGRVTIRRAVQAGVAVRAAGGDVESGAQVFASGTRLTSSHIGVIANLGQPEVVVRARPRAAIASTGDELVSVDGPPLQPGQIRDSNRPLVAGLLSELGATVVDLGHIPDRAEDLRSILAKGAETADVIITTGGVSMGEYDLVKQVLSELGTVDFWQVAMQPAKPFAFGRVGGRPFFGLPGNPVSAMVAFEQFVRPGLLKMMGASRLFRPRIIGRTAVTLETDSEKTVFVRVSTWTEGEVRWCRPSGDQSSNVLTAVAAADGFAVVNQGVGRVAAGDAVTLEMFRWPEDRTMDEL